MRVSNYVVAGCMVLTGSVPVLAQDGSVVVTVNYPLQYLAERLLDDTAEVVFPVPADVDPSFWRPSIADISAIQSADLILLNGAGFASWIDRVSLPRSKVVNTSAAIEDQFIITESITHSHGDGGEHSHEGLASYTWLDPMMAVAQAEAIAAAIVARGIAPADAVDARLDALRADFKALDAKTTATLDGLSDVSMIATHPRYQYLTRRYGLSLTALEWDAGVAPSDDQLAALAALVDENNATVLVWEDEPPASAFEATQALGLQNVVFSPLVHGIEDVGFLEAYAGAVAELAEAAAP